MPERAATRAGKPRTAAGAPLRELVSDYVENAERYWAEIPRGWRQSGKLEKRVSAARERYGWETAETVERAFTLAWRRRTKRPPTVYVLGLGGSGSHWVGAMLGDLPGVADADEVSFAPPLVEKLDAMPQKDAMVVVDAIHLLHAFPRFTEEQLKSASLVNTASGAEIDRDKGWDPKAIVIYLTRDPRDQIMSVVHRKDEYRKQVDAAASDDEYLARMARWNRRNFRAIQQASNQPDLVWSYEQLQHDPRPLLQELVTKLKLDAAAEQIETAVRNHNPELIARGQVPRRTNLHTGGSPTWQRLATESQRLMMHAETREAIESLGYDMDECLGRETPTQPLAEGLTVEFSDDPVGTVYVKPAGAASGLWDRLGPAAGSVSLPAGVAVKLALAPGRRRYRDALAGLPPGWLHGLCMAQVAVDPKPELEGLPLLDGLRELDLAYTRTAPGALGWLAGLDDLTGVSLLGTAITAQDLEAVVTSPAQRERFLLEMVTTE